MTKKWLDNIPYFVLFFITIFFLYMHIPNVGYDTPSYINFSVVRPPIYPIFIWLFHWAGKYQFQLIMWTQSLLTFFSLLYMRNRFRNDMKIPDFLIFFVFLFVLLTICFHFQMSYIQSEGLAFPFFIFTFFAMVKCFQTFTSKKIFYLACWVSILMLTRLQFYYFYGMFILLCVWYLWKKESIKSIFFCILILLSSILLTVLLDRSFHYFKNGTFKSEPISGIQFVIQPIFLTNSNATSYFTDRTEKTIVQNIIYEIEKNKLNKDSALLNTPILQYYEYAYDEYSRNYVTIQSIVHDEFSKNTLFDQNKTANKISKTLFFKEYKKNLFFYFWKVIDSMGGIPFFLFSCLLLFSAIIAAFKNRNFIPDIMQLFILLSLVITFFNALLVAAVEPALPPYFCYTQFLLYCLAAIFSKKLFF